MVFLVLGDHIDLMEMLVAVGFQGIRQECTETILGTGASSLPWSRYLSRLKCE